MEPALTQDIREILFRPIMSKIFSAQVATERDGIVSGSVEAAGKLAGLGLTVEFFIKEGAEVRAGDLIARFRGNPLQIAQAEERVMGAMAKVSGIATAARTASRLAGERCRVACGAWKKMPSEIKEAVRHAIVLGGASPRILDEPFVYLDKNYVRIFGGITKTLESATVFSDRRLIVQLKGETGSIRAETVEAVTGGAHVIMVDTGHWGDVETAISTIEELGVRNRIKIAFAGSLKFEDIPCCAGLGIDLLCIGREIVDAPLMDMKLDILPDRTNIHGN